MTPELSQRLESILSFLETSVKQGADFAVDQAPDVVNQLLAWRFSESLAMFLIGIVLAVTLVAVTVWIWRKFLKEEYIDVDDILFVVLLTAIVWLVMALPISFLISLDWLKIMIAPKLYLIEYAASFISK